MESAIVPVALMLLRQGRTLDKYDLEAEAKCNHRSAQRILRGLHIMKMAYITGWRTIYNAYIPVYAIQQDGTLLKDLDKPKPMTSAARARKRRKNPEVRLQEAYTKRMARHGKGAKHNPKPS